MELVLDVPPGSFNPPPKVDSAVVRMIPWPADKSPYAPVDMRALGTVVTMAFSQRRKVLRNTLGALRDVIDFDALGFDLGRRRQYKQAVRIRFRRSLQAYCRRCGWPAVRLKRPTKANSDGLLVLSAAASNRQSRCAFSCSGLLSKIDEQDAREHKHRGQRKPQAHRVV